MSGSGQGWATDGSGSSQVARGVSEHPKLRCVSNRNRQPRACCATKHTRGFARAPLRQSSQGSCSASLELEQPIRHWAASHAGWRAPCDGAHSAYCLACHQRSDCMQRPKRARWGEVAGQAGGPRSQGCTGTGGNAAATLGGEAAAAGQGGEHGGSALSKAPLRRSWRTQAGLRGGQGRGAWHWTPCSLTARVSTRCYITQVSINRHWSQLVLPCTAGSRSGGSLALPGFALVCAQLDGDVAGARD